MVYCIFRLHTGASNMGDNKRRFSVPLVERQRKMHEKDIDTSLAVSSLHHTQNKHLDKKDFRSEVRGQRDIMAFYEMSEVSFAKEKLWEFSNP